MVPLELVCHGRLLYQSDMVDAAALSLFHLHFLHFQNYFVVLLYVLNFGNPIPSILCPSFRCGLYSLAISTAAQLGCNVLVSLISSRRFPG
jgi:hypothetical protein